MVKVKGRDKVTCTLCKEGPMMFKNFPLHLDRKHGVEFDKQATNPQYKIVVDTSQATLAFAAKRSRIESNNSVTSCDSLESAETVASSESNVMEPSRSKEPSSESSSAGIQLFDQQARSREPSSDSLAANTSVLVSAPPLEVPFAVPQSSTTSISSSGNSSSTNMLDSALRSDNAPASPSVSQETNPTSSISDLSSQEREDHKLDTLITGVTTVGDLVYYCNDFLEQNEDGAVVCTVCNHIFSHAEGRRYLTNLKTSLKRHLSRGIHSKNKRQKEQDALQRKEDLKVAGKAALHCARCAYLCFKDDMSYDSYPHLVSLVHSCGGHIGHQQHSRAFVAKYLPYVADIIRTSLRNFVRDKPYGIMADKMTTDNRARHIFGIRISTLDDLTTDVCAMDLYLSHSVVEDVTGKGLAEHIMQCLIKFGFTQTEIRKALSGVAYDGQYVLLSVLKHLLRKLNIEDKLPETWDPMHNTELGYNDSETPFVAKCCGTVNEVMKAVKQGKLFEILLSNKDLCEFFLKPRIFKDMKFVDNASKVFETLSNDFPAIVATLQKTDSDLLPQLLKPSFIFNFIFLKEIVSVLGKMSKTFQKSNQLPHEYPRQLNIFLSELSQMKCQLGLLLQFIKLASSSLSRDTFNQINDKKTFEEALPEFKNQITAEFPSLQQDGKVEKLIVYAFNVVKCSTPGFQNTIKRLVMEKIFKGAPIVATLERTSRFTSPWTSATNMLISLQTSVERFQEYVNNLVSNLEERFSAMFDAQKIFGDLISFQCLMFPSTSHSVDDISLDDFIDKMKKFQFFPKHREEQLQMFTEYNDFKLLMVKTYGENRENRLVVSEIMILKNVYKGLETCTMIRTLLDYIVSCPSSEAICESWGSVIEKCTRSRHQSADGDCSTFGHVENRILIMLNGPPAGYKNNDSFLQHALQAAYGVNYNENFYVRSSKFKTLSKVLDNILQGTHDLNRYKGSKKILPCFR